VPEVERYGPGEVATRFDPGDFILAHRHNPMASLISLAQKLRFNGALVEAESSGVTRSPISRYSDDTFHLVRLGSELSAEGRKRAVDYTNAQVGQGFGYLAGFGAVIFLLTGLPLRPARRNHQICSGLVVRALQKGGLLKGDDPDLMLPADLAKMYSVRWSENGAAKASSSQQPGDATPKP